MNNSPYSKYIIPSSGNANTNFSEKVGFKRLGIHHVNLKPGERSSLPHAESHEEEFVFVISGRPHAWIDGYVYELHPNCAVGFPSGTGIGHNFINNTDANVELLVIGERTKDENLCAFPINPEQKETCGIWWDDAPQRALGPHNGQPGPVKPEELGDKWPDCIVDCTKLPLSSGWSYPGDVNKETFSNYARLTDHLKLKVLGIGFEYLEPGKRTALPHAHKVEEEFVYTLSGTAHVWMNGFLDELKQGQGVAFLPGTNIAHTVMNNTKERITIMVVGEATEDAGKDAVYYPKHDFRNEICRNEGYLWEDRPQDVAMGAHNGQPQFS